MNIEIANRLVELRKKNSLSQEELAAKLGLSRQAVSKWERAEASPDTDNLICLAKIYNISLDDLLKNEAPVEHIVEAERPEKSEKAEQRPPETQSEPTKKKSFVHIGKDGIHVIDDEDEVHISGLGINIKDGHTQVRLGPGGIQVGDSKIEEQCRKTRDLVTGTMALLTILAYVSIGGFLHIWHPTWIMFLLIPLAESIVLAVAYRRVTKLSFPVLVSGIYLLIGFLYGEWHPWWVLFITIPIFYLIFRPIEKLWLKDKTVTIDGVEVKLDEVGEGKSAE